MALGDNYNNNKDKDKDKNLPTVYSMFKTSNTEGFDPSSLNYTFWGNGMLKVSISPKKAGEEVRFDHENAIAIYLTHMKAKQLAAEIELFLQDPLQYNNVGISSGAGLVSIDNGLELTGALNPCLIIRTIKESGEIDSTFAYQFKRDYYFSIRNFEEKTQAYDKVFDNDLELHAFKTLLLEYYAAMSGASAYAQMYYDRFNNSKVQTKLDSIAEKLGVEFAGKKDGKSSGGGSSFFNNSSKGTQRNASGSLQLDDIE